MIKNQKKAYFYASIAVFFWSTVASAFKISLQYMEPSMLLMLSSLVSFLLFTSFIVVSKKGAELKQLKVKDYIHSAILGFLNPFLYYIILFQAYDLLPAQQAQPINFLWPIVLVLLSVPLLGQKLSLRDFLAVMVSFSGVAAIASKGSLEGFASSDPLGISLALVSTIVWALFWILNVKDHKNEIVKLFLNFGFGFLFSFIYVLINGDFILPPLSIWGGVIYVGLFEMGLTFYFWLKALQYSERTASVTNLIFLVPFFSLIVISYVLDEKILFSTVIGLVLIVVGIIMQQKKNLKKD